MDTDDVVDPGDAAVQALLALTAENTRDPEKRDFLIDAIPTLPLLTEWPPESREKLVETCQFIKGLAEDLRRRSEIIDIAADSDRSPLVWDQSDEHGPNGDRP